MRTATYITSHQDRMYDWASGRGILAEGNMKTHILKATEELGEISECINDYMPDLVKYGSEIADLMSTLFIIVEQQGRADMRVILANVNQDPNLEMNSSLSAFQRSYYGSEKGRKLDNFYEPKDLALLASTQLGQLARAVNREDKDLFNKSIAGLMITLMTMASKHDMDVDVLLDQNFEKISKRTGTTLNGLFIKSEDITV